jgi:putative pyrroloquinoline-quinone binding quinoprotein
MDESHTSTRRQFLSGAAFALGSVCLPEAPGEAAGSARLPLEDAPPGKEPGGLGAARGEWRQYRGDQRLSGRSGVRGKIEQPAILWSHSLGGRETLLSAALKNGSETVSLPVDDVSASPAGRTWGQIQMDWRVAGPYGLSWYDLDGDGRLTGMSRSYNQKIGKALPDQPGLQLIEAEPKGYPKVPDVYKGSVRLKVREKGRWVTRWETETDTLIWQAEPIFGDFDGDGRNEVALLPWWRLNVLDAETGRIKEQAAYLAEDESEIPGLGGRAYGWFGAMDIDGDGETEFVIIEDFIRYAAVLKRQGGQLRRLWLNVWQPRKKAGESLAPEEAVVVRINPEPVQDVDGDGRKEIVVSVFNLNQDNRWRILVLDPLTGAAKLELPGQFLTGMRDADGDGLPELFCTAVESGPRIPDPASLSLYSLRGGKPVRTWELSNASFVTHTVESFPSNVNTGASLGGETILCRPLRAGQPSVFFTRRLLNAATGEVRVTAWQADRKRRFRLLAEWTGPRIEPLAVRTDPGGVLLRATAFEGERARLRCAGKKVHTEVLVSQRVPAPLSPVVVGRPEPEARPIVVVQGANECVEAFRPGDQGETERVWRAPGRGTTCNNYFEGVLLADLTGGGSLSVVVGARGPGDCARLKVLSARDGKTVWSRDFPDFPGAPPPWNTPGLMYWQGGWFRHGSRMDLLVQMRRVGGESYLLDGRTGEVVWRRATGRPGRDFGRWWMAMYDFDGDGLEDVLNVYPDMFCVARGRDGALLAADESVRRVGIYAYYADVLVADFLRKGEPQVLYLHESVTALLTGRGEVIWKVDHPHPDGWRNPAGWGDADGAGTHDLFFPGAMGKSGREFQCRDAATGALKWNVPLPDEPCTFPAVADIDGDGRDECLFTSGAALYAVGAAKTRAASGNAAGGGAVLWKLDLPARAGPVAYADVRGAGAGEIVVGCADGRVYGIGNGRLIERRPSGGGRQAQAPTPDARVPATRADPTPGELLVAADQDGLALQVVLGVVLAEDVRVAPDRLVGGDAVVGQMAWSDQMA